MGGVFREELNIDIMMEALVERFLIVTSMTRRRGKRKIKEHIGRKARRGGIWSSERRGRPDDVSEPQRKTI